MYGDGLSTTVQPIPSAGNTLPQLTMNGMLNGVIAATTPTGSRTTMLPTTRPSGPMIGGSGSTSERAQFSANQVA